MLTNINIKHISFPAKMEAKSTLFHFEVRKHVNFSESLYVLGSIGQLGNWQPSSANKMSWRSNDYWDLKIQIPIYAQFEYKYAVVDATRKILYWELRSNRFSESVNRANEYWFDKWSSHFGDHEWIFDRLSYEYYGHPPQRVWEYKCKFPECYEKYEIPNIEPGELNESKDHKSESNESDQLFPLSDSENSYVCDSNFELNFIEKASRKTAEIESVRKTWANTDILSELTGKIYELTDECFYINTDDKPLFLKKYVHENSDTFFIEASLNEYNITKFLGEITEHVAKPIKLGFEKTETETHIEILYENGGLDLIELMQRVKSDTVILWFMQSLKLMKLLELNGIFHSDLKTDNFVFRNGILKLIDFEHSENLKSIENLNKVIPRKKIYATDEYLPPELLNEKRDDMLKLGKIDIYCWGMTFYQIITLKTNEEICEENNKFKLGNETEYKEFMKVLKNSKTKRKNPEKLEKLLSIVEMALAFNPNERKSFAELEKLAEINLS